MQITEHFTMEEFERSSTADRLGIAKSRAVTYRSDRLGTLLNFSVLDGAVSSVRRSEELSEDWKLRIEQDFVRRK